MRIQSTVALINAEPVYINLTDVKNLASARKDCDAAPFSSEFFAAPLVSRSLLSRVLPASRDRHERAMDADVRAMNAQADRRNRATGKPRRSSLAGTVHPRDQDPAVSAPAGTDASEKIFTRISDGAWMRPPSEHDDSSSCASDEHDHQTPAKPKQFVLVPTPPSTSLQDDSSEPSVSTPPTTSRFMHRAYSYYWVVPPPPLPGSTEPLSLEPLRPSVHLKADHEACFGANCERAAGLRGPQKLCGMSLAIFEGGGSQNGGSQKGVARTGSETISTVSTASTLRTQLEWLQCEMGQVDQDASEMGQDASEVGQDGSEMALLPEVEGEPTALPLATGISAPGHMHVVFGTPVLSPPAWPPPAQLPPTLPTGVTPQTQPEPSDVAHPHNSPGGESCASDGLPSPPPRRRTSPPRPLVRRPNLADGAEAHRSKSFLQRLKQVAALEKGTEPSAAPHPCSLLAANAPWRRPAARLSPLTSPPGTPCGTPCGTAQVASQRGTSGRSLGWRQATVPMPV